MLKRILRLILEEKVAQKRKIAKKLGVQMSALDDMLGILLENGYLRLGKCDCNPEVTCPTCPMADTCREKSMVSQEYYITQKGSNYVKADSSES